VKKLEADEVVIDMGNGEVLTLRLADVSAGSVWAFAGKFRSQRDDGRTAFFVLRPGAINAMTIQVKSEPRRSCTPESCGRGSATQSASSADARQ
jgi:hypothetical protein